MEKDKKHESPNSSELSSLDPSPVDFEKFLPWAATKFGSFKPIKIIRTHLSKENRRAKEIKSDFSIKTSSLSDYSETTKDILNIVLRYQAEDLVHILFEKSKLLPRMVLQIIGLIIEFHPHLTGITVNCGIDKYTCYELNKFLPLSNITEICLNDTFVAEANYALLLDGPNHLQILSLSRCRIGDQVVKDIAEKLQYPLPASKTLLSLNLSSNSLTDQSAANLARALRTNRKLCHLNIASNGITDTGGEAILNALKPFPLTFQEQLDFKQRRTKYLKLKQRMIEEYIKKTGVDKNACTKKDRKMSLQARNQKDERDIIYEKAEYFVQARLGEFNDPMKDSFVKEDIRYSNGNNTLIYLNIAYNNLTRCFLKPLVKVFQHQQASGKKNKGLCNIHLDGNPIPQFCTELIQIGTFIAEEFALFSKHAGYPRRRKK